MANENSPLKFASLSDNIEAAKEVIENCKTNGVIDEYLLSLRIVSYLSRLNHDTYHEAYLLGVKHGKEARKKHEVR